MNASEDQDLCVSLSTCPRDAKCPDRSTLNAVSNHERPEHPRAGLDDRQEHAMNAIHSVVSATRLPLWESPNPALIPALTDCIAVRMRRDSLAGCTEKYGAEEQVKHRLSASEYL